MRSRKLYEPFKQEMVPESAIVVFMLKYPLLCRRVYDLHEWYRSHIKVGKYQPHEWRHAGKVFGTHEDTTAWLWLIHLTFNYSGKPYWQSSYVSRFLNIYRKHFVK